MEAVEIVTELDYVSLFYFYSNNFIHFVVNHKE